MFQKSPKYPQVDLFFSAGRHLDERRRASLAILIDGIIPSTSTYSVKCDADLLGPAIEATEQLTA